MTRFFSITLILSFVLLALFSALNWDAMTALFPVNLGFLDVGAPLGLILLAFTLAISALFVLYVGVLQAGLLIETRRLTKEVHAQRELADRAEASRFTELRGVVAAELQRIEGRIDASHRAVEERVDAAGGRVHARLDESTNAVSAHLGEIEDKLDRVLHTRQP